MRTMDYRKVLNLSVNESLKYDRFYAKIHNYFVNSNVSDFDEIYEQTFCDAIGVEMKVRDKRFDELLNEPQGLDRAWIYMEKCKSDFYELLFRCVTLINTLPKSQKKLRDWLYDLVVGALDDCQIQYEILNDKDGVFIIPKGAKELDDALVSQPLEWLKSYPQAHKTFCIALRQYNDGVYIRDIADNLRKALEAFLQEFLHNEKNLETNKNEICKYLGEQGVDAGISGLFQPLINSYKNINDRIAKHNDAVDKKLLEFLLYQTGVLIRMVIVVSKEAEPHAD